MTMTWLSGKKINVAICPLGKIIFLCFFILIYVNPPKSTISPTVFGRETI